MTFDLAIIGAGPAGCAAAITAARSGARVLILEAGSFPRQKVCGEFVSAESLALLQNLLANSFCSFQDPPRISEARIFLDGAVLQARVSPAASSITRFDLDCALWSAAVDTGVSARANSKVRSIEGNGPFQVLTAQAAFEARAVVNATGRWSNLTNPAKLSRRNGEKWLGIKAHFYEPAVSASVDLYFFEGGYCGVQPVSSGANGSGVRINACAMVRAEVASTMDEVLKQDPTLFERAKFWIQATEPVTTSPLVFHDPEPIQNAMLQVGDAAMFVDPFIGDGISLALRSGALAADCLIPAFRGDSALEEARARYCREYQLRFAHIIRASSRLRQVLRWPRSVRKPVLSVLARAPLLTSQLVKMTR